MQRFLVELMDAKRLAGVCWENNRKVLHYIDEIYDGLINMYLAGELLPRKEFLGTLFQADISVIPLWTTYMTYASEELYR